MRKCRIGTAKFFTLLLLLYRTSVNATDLYACPSKLMPEIKGKLRDMYEAPSIEDCLQRK